MLQESKNASTPPRSAPPAPKIQRGIYEADASKLHHGQEIVVLPGAVPNPQLASGPGSVQYGWVRGLLPAPNPADIYLVRFFLSKSVSDRGHYMFRVVAYVDRYGRVFGVENPLTAPPARYPDLAFAFYKGKTSKGGCVQTYNESGKHTVVANYEAHDEEYRLCNSWYDFGDYGARLSLDEALARAFFAFVWRPKCFHKSVPPRGLGVVNAHLTGHDAIRALRRTSKFLAAASDDAALRMPAAAQCLYRWLHEAGLADAWGQTRHAGGRSYVTLRRQTDYSDRFSLQMEDESPVSERIVWKLESALNRYEMVVDGLGDRAAFATMEECSRVDSQLRERFALQVGEDLTPADDVAGEWAVRAGIARAVEEALVPTRFAVDFRADVEAGVVAFELLVPDADMAPNYVWAGVENDGDWTTRTKAKRMQSAREYAQRLGLMLAAIAARTSARVHTVTVTAEWFFEVEQDHEAMELDADGKRHRISLHDPSAEHAYSVIIECDHLRQPGVYRQAVLRPGVYFSGLPRLSQVYAETETVPRVFEEPTPFWLVTNEPNYRRRFDLPDLEPRAYTSASAMALGCNTSEGLAINYNAAQRHMAEHVAETLLGCRTVSEGVAALRQVQESSNDPGVLQACTRLMTQLVTGDLRMADQNRVVTSFLGNDRFEEALRKCRIAHLSQDPQASKHLDDLRKLVDETMSAGVFADTDTEVYRVFDSSTVRIVYNLAQTGRLRIRGLTERIIADNGKNVSLAPDSYYHCCLELVRLLERSFDQSEDALRYGREAVRLGPTMPGGYRQLARAYMLMGDVNQAHDLLVCALQFAVERSEISWLYYQLAYVEWKAGRVRSAQACYIKSIVEDSGIARVAGAELREMLTTERAPIMQAQEVEATLALSGIPLAPTGEMLDILQSAGHAAVDEGAFLVARNVLTMEFHHRPDDALVHILRSLDR